MTPSDIPWGYSRTDRKSAAATQNTEDFRLAATLDIARHFTCLLRESDFITAEGKYGSDDVVCVEPTLRIKPCSPRAKLAAVGDTQSKRCSLVLSHRGGCEPTSVILKLTGVFVVAAIQ
jgi:hypothetical protein